jgi:hypothetical protein
MFRGRFLGFLFVLLLAAGLLGLAGSSIYRAGWTQGYFVGKVSDGVAAGETTVISPEAGVPEAGVPEAGVPEAGIPAPAAGQPMHVGRGFSPAGSFFGSVVKCFFFLFLMAMFFKFIGLLMWRRGGHRGWHKHGRWHKGGHWGKHHNHTPPWYDDESDEPMKA